MWEYTEGLPPHPVVAEHGLNLVRFLHQALVRGLVELQRRRQVGRLGVSPLLRGAQQSQLLQIPSAKQVLLQHAFQP